MLNPTLYEALKAAYGSVEIHGEDTVLTLEKMPVSDRFQGRTGIKITSDMVDEGGEYYAVNCPFCPDKRQRLWVCYAWGSKVPINGKEYQVSKGLVHCYNEYCMRSTENWRNFCKSIEGTWKPQIVAMGEAHDRLTGEIEPPVEMPHGNYYVDDPNGDKQVQEYLLDRGFNPYALKQWWDFRIGQTGFYDAPAIVMPVTCHGRYRFWQARYPCKGKIPEFFRDGRRKPKYYIPAGAKKSRVLYNFDRAVETETIVLTEGIFDAVRVGLSGVAMFGKKPSTRQQYMLSNDAYDKTIIWIPDMDDPDAIEYARSYTERWNNGGIFKGGAHVLTLADGDPADHTQEELCSLMQALLAQPK